MFDQLIMDRVVATNNRAMKEFSAGKHLAAANSFQKAYSLMSYDDPATRAQLAFNVASTLMELNEYTAALKWCDISLSHKHDDGVAYSKCLCNMHLGRFEAGLQDYKYRYLKDAADAVRFPKLPIPFVDDEIDGEGEIFRGKRVLVLNEQGFGDEILFLRAMDNLSKQCAAAKVQVYPELLRLVRSTIADRYTNITFFAERSLSVEDVKTFDLYTATGSLWAAFQRFETLPPINFGRAKVVRQSDKVSIGFITSPNKASKNAQSRAVAEKVFKRLGNENRQLYNLQYRTNFAWADNTLSHEIDDFYDLYEAMSAMDVVVTCDTGAAHLAHSMDIPAILVYTNYLDWRWEYRTFYPNAKIIQARCVDKLSAAIDEYVSGVGK